MEGYGFSSFVNAGMRDVGIQHFRYGVSHVFPVRRLPEYAIVCCQAGRIDVMESNAWTTLLPGEILVGNPGLLRASHYLPQGGVCEGITIVVGVKLMQRLLQEIRLVREGEGALLLGKLSAPNLVAQVQTALKTAGAGRPGSGSYLDGFLGQFLVELLWNWPQGAIVPRRLSLGQWLTRRNFVSAVEYMNRCGKQEFRVEQMCEEIGMSLASFRRLLLSSAQQTPLDFYNQVLIYRAQNLIRNRLSLKEVCYELGFASQSQFGKLFRQRIGCSPSEYQERKSVMEAGSVILLGN